MTDSSARDVCLRCEAETERESRTDRCVHCGARVYRLDPEHSTTRTWELTRWGSIGTVAGPIACLLYAAGAGNHDGLFRASLGAATLVGAVGSLAGAQIGRWVHDRRSLGELQARARRAQATTTFEAMPAATEVRLVGTVRARATVPAPWSLRACVAFTVRELDGRGPPVKLYEASGGERFELDDGSGGGCLVDCTHAVILEALRATAGEVTLTDGARVEVTGHARRVRAPQRLVAAHHRAMPTMLVVWGTRERPLVLRSL